METQSVGGIEMGLLGDDSGLEERDEGLTREQRLAALVQKP